MATLQQIDELVLGVPTLFQRFRAARIEAAWDILNEDPSTENHVDRLAWANTVVSDYVGGNIQSEYRLFLSNATIQTSGIASTDNDIQYVVNTFVDTWAG